MAKRHAHARHAAAAEAPQRAHRARRDPRPGAPISRAEISRRGGHLEADRLARAAVAPRRGARPRGVADDPGRPSYGAVFFEPVPEAALVLGLDLGARFLRGAICDLHGEVRARQDVELSGADADDVLDVARRASRLARRRDRAGATDLLDGAVVGVPGVVERATGASRLTSVAGPGRDAVRRRGRASGSASPVIADNDINLAAVGEQWRGVARGVDDFVFLSVGTGLGAGLVLRRRAAPRPQRRRRRARPRLGGAPARTSTPARGALSALAARLAADWRRSDTALGAALRPARDLRRRRAPATPLAQRSSRRRRAGSRCTSCPIAAVADVALVVLGGGLGANGDLLLEPVREPARRLAPLPAARRGRRASARRPC